MAELTKQELDQIKLKELLFSIGFDGDDDDSFFIIHERYLYTVYLTDDRTKIDLMTVYYLDQDGVAIAETYECLQIGADIRSYFKEFTEVEIPKEMFKYDTVK